MLWSIRSSYVACSRRPSGRQGYRRAVYRFLLAPRWLALAAAVLVLAAVCVRLGLWQFDRLGERREVNAVVDANLSSPAVPLRQLVAVGAAPAAAEEWRTVTLRGRYDAEDRLLVRYQTHGSLRGVDVVVPLRLDDDSFVLVDRGFLESPAGTPDADEVPAPPAGTVQVTGRLRQDSDAPAEGTTPVDGTVRAVSSRAVADVVDGPLRGGWVQAVQELPEAPGEPLMGPEPPETGIGPHLFYGLQWFFFGFLALLGYGWFAYDEANPHRPRRRAPWPDRYREDQDVERGERTVGAWPG